MLDLELTGKAKIVYHRTHEIVKLIEPEICDLIISMNITISLLRRVASPEKTTLYYVSCHRLPNDFVKQAFPIATNHLKLYRTDSRVIISTANLSLSNWNEVSLIFDRNEDLDRFVAQIVQDLKIVNAPVYKYH